jgi:hypothetical protein
MPKTSKDTHRDGRVEGYEVHFGHFGHLDGGYSVGFETYTADAISHRFSRRPGRPVPVPALGLRGQGQLTFTFTDSHEETYEAG